jgi:glycosyltransferase involved in cell wall biosynthesis
MSLPFVSVVTPVYNTGPYLEQAIKSVLEQTHSDFEYVISDNHSTDQSGEIARDYASRDRRIKVVSPPTFFDRYSHFNFVLQQISERSAYCKMLLSDDWLFPDCLRAMVAVGAANPNVGMVSSYRVQETELQCGGLPVDRSVFSGREAARSHLYRQAYPFGSQSTCMYRADIVRARAPHFFVEIMNCDLDVAMRIMQIGDFGFVHQVLSFTRLQAGSVMEQNTRAFNAWLVWLVSQLVVTLMHGRAFLSETEYAERIEHIYDQYYQSLGRVWLKDRTRMRASTELWNFHKQKLASVGVSIDRKRLARGVGNALLAALRQA